MKNEHLAKEFFELKGYQFEEGDELWMVEILNEHSFKDLFELMEAYADFKLSHSKCKVMPLELNKYLKPFLQIEETYVDDESQIHEVPIGWDTIREIYNKIVKYYH